MILGSECSQLGYSVSLSSIRFLSKFFLDTLYVIVFWQSLGAFWFLVSMHSCLIGSSRHSLRFARQKKPAGHAAKQQKKAKKDHHCSPNDAVVAALICVMLLH